MPSLIDLRRRVRAVKNTQQITKAMKMVAASKLRRAQERIMSARPYAVQMQRVLGSVARASIRRFTRCSTVREPRPDSRTLVIVVTGDKGLCGSFNTNVIKGGGALHRRAARSRARSGWSAARAATSSAGAASTVLFEQVGIFQKLRYDDAQAIAQTAIDAFIVGRGRPRGAGLQRVQVGDVAAGRRRSAAADCARATSTAAATGAAGGESQVDYLYEPSPQEIFDQLLPRYVEVQVYRALLESNAAFFAAQMTAMDTATKNSADMIAQPDAVHEQGAPGGDHARDHRSGVRAPRRSSESGRPRAPTRKQHG